MASAAPPSPPDTEPPECPVCLCPFDAASVVPRVLPCGHSLCGTCISSLPPASALAAAAASLRCPLCSQCVPFSRALGPSSLPKNLALLSLLPSLPNPSPARSAGSGAAAPPLPLPLHAAHSRLLARFRHAILPESASPLQSAPPGPAPAGLVLGSIASDLGAPWFCSRGHPVSLLPVEAPAGGAPPQEAAFYRPSHAARVVAAIDALRRAATEEIIDLVAASTRLARRVCRVYGAWMGPEVSTLWLVSERHTCAAPLLLEEGSSDELEMVARIRAVGMEVCEALMGLHGEGLLLGCLRLGCFRHDRFGGCLLDLNEVLALCRRVRAGLCLAKGGALVAPEMAAVLSDAARMRSRDFDGLIGCSSDVWLLGCILVALVTGDEQLAAGWNTDGSHDDWLKEVLARLEAALIGTHLEPLAAVTMSCLSYEPEDRPEIADVWKCIRDSWMKPVADALAVADGLAAQKSFRCLLLGELSSMCSGPAVESDDKMQASQGSDDSSSTPDGEISRGCMNNESVCTAGVDEIQRDGVFKSSTLLAHRDCVTGLAIGAQKSFRCLLLGELSSMCSGPAVESDDKMHASRGSDDNSSTLDDETNRGCTNNESVCTAGVDEVPHDGVFKSSTLLAHRDCVTGLAIGGGFLFSCSYDKTINIWSLQDLSHVQTLKGHEHKIMAIVVIDNDNEFLCISGDSGSGIFVWHVDSSLNQEPLNKWYEHNDWIYRGVHCLAVSGTGYLYTGSRDKTIKAWSLEDYSLWCTMTGHKSTVSCLAVASGILYSGSWDGTIRSWWLTDHSPLSVLEDNTLGSIAPVLSIATEVNFVVSSYENGYLKIWKDDVIVKSEKLQNGSIYAVKLNGKWLYIAGMDKVINIQELLEDESEVEIRDVASIACDSVVTSMLCWNERLIVGLSNREIKVFDKVS